MVDTQTIYAKIFPMYPIWQWQHWLRLNLNQILDPLEHYFKVEPGIYENKVLLQKN